MAGIKRLGAYLHPPRSSSTLVCHFEKAQRVGNDETGEVVRPNVRAKQDGETWHDSE